MSSGKNQKELKTIVKILYYISLVLTIIAILAWVNNISVTSQWDPMDSLDVIYHGSVTVLDWTGIKFSAFFDAVSVDFSTATTFIPFLGLLMITIGLKKVQHVKEGDIIPDYFPFFKTFNTAVIALGLIGTVWGLIMIGYGDLEAFDLQRLTNALHTSLFSTLIALIWVFILLTPISKFMQWLWYNFSGLEISRPTSEGIIQEMTNFANSINSATRQLKDFSKDMDLDFFTLLKENVQGLARVTTSIEEVIKQQKTMIEKQQEYQEYQRNIFAKIIEGIIERLKREEKRVSFMETAVRNAADFVLKAVGSKKQ